jgi:SAM-dependent methyltransferase
MKPRADYDNFAWLYNIEWADFGNNIFPFLKQIAGEDLPDGAIVLDLCCGTGQLAKVLTENGYKVTGIDVSADQLYYARKNTPEARFLRRDARDFKLPCKYEAVFSTFDALNHILRLAELRQVFQNVSNCLVQGGIFIFDLNTKREFDLHWNGVREIVDKPDYHYAAEMEYSPTQRLGQFRLVLFRQAGKTWQRYNTTLYETYYSKVAVISALKKAGFNDIKTYAYSSFEGISPDNKNTTRIFYAARKS